MAELFKSVQLKRNNGGAVSADELNDKVVGLYFSAHWCPPCKMFTPQLKEFYEELANSNFEIVFLSLDRSEEECNEYLAESHELADKFKVDGIPAFVIVKSDGTVISADGRAEVSSTPPRAALSAWQAQL